ncbi:MAG: carboxypeptidase regulatory-like domain-containing protein, partial [Planctomycetes bacterium]|nr:carboxypeptidase regulatory-like domain-containing protein [Planctomycetota bacterium]
MPNKSLLLVLALVVLALATWFLLRGDTTSIRPDTTFAPSAFEQVAEPPVTDAAPAGTASGDVTGVEGSATGQMSPAGERVEAGTSATGQTGPQAVTIRGRLVDGEGRPMPGVAMRVASWRNPDASEFFVPPAEGRPRTELTTGANGAFEFTLAGEHSARLQLPDDELIFEVDARPIHASAGDQDLGAIVVCRSAKIAGTVRDEHGVPAAGVSVTAGSGMIAIGSTSSSKTDDKGQFTIGKLRRGSWTLRTESAQFLPASTEVEVSNGERVDGIVLEVARGRAIAGQVLDDLGHPVVGITVGAKRAEANGGIDIERFSAGEATQTDERGMFTLSGLEGETATVRAYGAGHSAAIAANVRVGTGSLVLRVDRLAAIEGVLQATDGTPLEGSRVRAVSEAGDVGSGHGIEGMLGGRGASVRTAADGSFRIENVKPGIVTVTAEGQTHRPARQVGISVRPAETAKG